MVKDRILYVFDVDGTLTPSRQKMDESFKTQFKEFFKNKEYALVSGSDYEKIEYQVGKDIIDDASIFFPCSGNNVWIKSLEVYKSSWIPEQELLLALEEELNTSSWTEKTGKHIEMRVGLINFSIVGRNCSTDIRSKYNQWDSKSGERSSIQNRLKQKFPHLTFEIGGEISIDIYPNGCDKSQILKYLKDYTIYFFGDGISPGKNDWTLAQSLYGKSKYTSVNNWYDTKIVLDTLTENQYNRFCSD